MGAGFLQNHFPFRFDFSTVLLYMYPDENSSHIGPPFEKRR
jgi:hypothetical protein